MKKTNNNLHNAAPHVEGKSDDESNKLPVYNVFVSLLHAPGVIRCLCNSGGLTSEQCAVWGAPDGVMKSV